MKSPLSLIRSWFDRKFVEPKRKRLAAIETENGLLRLATVFETLNKFRKAGLLYVDFKHNAVTIEQGLAEQFLFGNADLTATAGVSAPTADGAGASAHTAAAPSASDDSQWQGFLHNLQSWAHYEFAGSEYTRQRTKLMADAEARAYAEAKDKSAFDESARQLAKMRAVAQLDQTLAEHPTQIPDLHYYVIGTDGPILVARLIAQQHRFVTASVKD